MSVFLIVTNLAGASNATADAGISALATPIWVLAIGVPVALLILAAVLGSVRVAIAAEPEGASKTDFTKMLCERIWAHTDTAMGRFAQRLRNHPDSLSSLQIQVRALREDLSEAVLYIDYMKAFGAAAWPSPRLFAAYSTWAGQIASMETQLADLYAQISRPIAQEPVDKDRETRLIAFYENEQRVLNRGVDKLHGHAFRLCEVARGVLKKSASSSSHSFGFRSGHDDDDDEHANCPCCKRASDRHVAPRLDDLPITIVSIEAKKEEKHHAPPPPAPQLVSAAPVFSIQPVGGNGSDDKKH